MIVTRCRHRLSLSLLFACAAVLLAPAAQAGSGKTTELESKKVFSASMSLGALMLEDTNIQSSYTDMGQFLAKLTLGVVPWSKYVHVEVNLGFGFSEFTGSQTFVSSSESSVDGVKMTVLPLSLDLLVGVDIFDEQPIVPFGGIGLAWTAWTEAEVEGDSTWNGYRLGPNYFFGAAILLDGIERVRSRKLDADMGINDAYLTVEGRYSGATLTRESGEWSDEGLSFAGWSVTGGLKIVF